MIGGFRFALARARAALPQLITLAIVAAIASALLVSIAGAVRAAEAHEVRAAVATAPGDLGRFVIDVRGGPADEVAAAVDALVSERGLGDALQMEVEGADVVVVPDADTISGVHLAGLEELLAGFTDEVEGAAGTTVQVSGALDVTIGDVSAAVEARRGPTAVALGLLGLMTAVVVGAVATEAARVRADENRLLRARGARRRSLFWSAALETIVVALVGAVVGAVLGGALVSLIGGVALDPATGAVAALAIAVVAALVAAIVTARGVDRASPRARAVVGIGAGVLLAVVTAVAAWRFAQAGTPIVVRGDGTRVLDPLVAVAPALVLALAALVAVAVAAPVARGIAASLARTRPVSPVTPLRLAARRPGRHALSIVVVAFAIGAVTIAGAYRGSLDALGNAPEQLRVGADVRVGTIPDDVDVAEIAALQPSTASMFARSVSADGADTRIPVLAVQATQLGAIMHDAAGAVDPSALSADLALGDAGVALDGDALTFTLVAGTPDPVVVDGEEIALSPTAGYVRATLLSPDGVLVSSVAQNFEQTDELDGLYCNVVVDPALAVEVPVPDGGPWTLVGLDAAIQPACASDQPELSVTDAASGGASVDLSSFRPVAGTPGAVEVTDAGISFAPTLQGNDNAWTRAVADGVPSPMPVAVTAGIAESMSLESGDDFSLEMSSPDFDADFVVADVIPVLPGAATGEGILVDLTTLSLASPGEILPNQVWMSSPDPAALAAAVEADFPQTATVVADPQSARNAAATANAFLLAAAGAVVLAIVVLVLRRTRTRGDARELALLAVLGMGRRRASAVRAQEDTFTVAMGVVGGVAAGALTAWLIVPALVRAAYGRVPDGFRVALEPDYLVLAGAIALASLLFGVIAWTVRTPARLAPLLREDE